jgi:transposase-like protein
MGRASPFVPTVSDEDRAELERRVRSHTAPQRDVLRASIVLMAADGEENVVIAEAVGVAPNTVLKWRKRFFEEGLEGLADRKRSGRPRSFSPSGPGRGQAARL